LLLLYIDATLSESIGVSIMRFEGKGLKAKIRCDENIVG
jgi:hypothetical protein